MLDYIAAGEYVAISAAAGTGAAHPDRILNAAATAGSPGQARIGGCRNKRSAAEEFVARFNEHLDSGSMLLEPNEDPDALRAMMTKAILRNERATEPQLGSMFKRLRESRHALHEHVKSLAFGPQPLGMLAIPSHAGAGTPLRPGTGSIHHRAPEAFGAGLHGPARTRRRAALKRAAQLGAFSKEHTTSPWHGAPLRNTEATEKALNLASGLGRDLPILALAHAADRRAFTYPPGRKLRQVGRPTAVAGRRTRVAG